MIIKDTEIVSALSTVLPTYYENFTDSAESIPCISYREYQNNEDKTHSNKLYFATISYYIKLWCKSKSDMATYLPQIDTKMRELGFYRSNTNEMPVGNLLCKIMGYSTYEEEHIQGD